VTEYDFELMASPRVAGVLLYLQGNTTAAPSAVTSAVTGGASANKLTSIGTGSPNLLLFAFIWRFNKRQT